MEGAEYKRKVHNFLNHSHCEVSEIGSPFALSEFAKEGRFLVNNSTSRIKNTDDLLSPNPAPTHLFLRSSEAP